MKSARLLIGGSLLLVLGACATAPVGPRVGVMPAPGKPFEVFIGEDQMCRQWAEHSSGANAANSTEAGNKAWVNSAAAGTALGAVVGALAGGRDGAATGAALGMVVGSASGAEQSGVSSYDMQRRYDMAYQQCMYAKGNQVPGYRAQVMPSPPPAPPAPATYAPTPPPPPAR
jgi:hypothetical protein